MSLKDVEKAERALASYQFMVWLDKFRELRECKTNINTPQDDFNLSDDNESVFEDGETLLLIEKQKVGSHLKLMWMELTMKILTPAGLYPLVEKD